MGYGLNPADEVRGFFCERFQERATFPASVQPTSALACPWPMPYSDFRWVTISMCFSRPQSAMMLLAFIASYIAREQRRSRPSSAVRLAPDCDAMEAGRMARSRRAAASFRTYRHGERVR